MKTKLGVSVGLLGAVIYLAALFGGYTPLILLAGYVLLFEENEWIKKSAVKAVVLMLSITFAITLIGLIPDIFSWISSLLSLIHINLGYRLISFIDSIIGIITSAIGIIKTFLFLALGLKALNQGTINVPYVDKIVDKYF